MDFTLSHLHVPYLYETMAFLLCVCLIVPLFKAIKISPILGFLGIGALIGPFGIALIKDAAAVQHFAEIGVIILLFTIGLELSFARLKSFAKLIFGLGALQVVVNAIAIGLFAYFWGNSVNASIVIGLCLALSSTAMVMQILHERHESATPQGQASFAVLLFQDLAVVPVLILLPILGGDNNTTLTTALLTAFIKAAVTIGFLMVIGKYVLRFAFRAISKLHNIDVFTALTLLVVLATSAITGLAGLSMALGAFLAGLLLAETEFRHKIENEIEPFKGLFLGLFFMGVGMNLDFAVAFERGAWVILAVIGLLAIKTGITTLIARMYKLSWPKAIQTGLMVSQGGEFAFVVIGQATFTYGLIQQDVAQFMVVVAGLSMACTPFLAILGDKIADRFPKPPITPMDASEQSEHIIIVGFGRVGQAVANILTQNAVDFIALDTDAAQVRKMQEQNCHVFLGDAAKTETLKHAGILKASTLLITMDNPKAAKHLLEQVRHAYPHLFIVVRSKDNAHAKELMEAGANQVVPETQEASFRLAAQVLHSTGMPTDEVNACIESIRRDEYLQI